MFLTVLIRLGSIGRSLKSSLCHADLQSFGDIYEKAKEKLFTQVLNNPLQVLFVLRQCICPLQLDYSSSLLTAASNVTLNVSSQSRMPPLDWSQGHVVMTTSPRFLQHSTGFQCSRGWCSRLWCWCGSVLTALLPATSPNSAFLLPLLQVVSISGQPWRAYTTSSQSPNHDRQAELNSLSRDYLCRTVFLLLYGDQRWLCTLSRDNWNPICSTSDVLANRRNIHHRPALLWRFSDSGAGYKTADLLTYFLHQLLLRQSTASQHYNLGPCKHDK